MFIKVRPRKKQNSRKKRAFSRQRATRAEIREDVNRWDDDYVLRRAAKEARRHEYAKRCGRGLM